MLQHFDWPSLASLLPRPAATAMIDGDLWTERHTWLTARRCSAVVQGYMPVHPWCHPFITATGGWTQRPRPFSRWLADSSLNTQHDNDFSVTAKIRNLKDYHSRTINGVLPVASGADIANTLKYFSQTLLGYVYVFVLASILFTITGLIVVIFEVYLHIQFTCMTSFIEMLAIT